MTIGLRKKSNGIVTCTETLGVLRRCVARERRKRGTAHNEVTDHRLSEKAPYHGLGRTRGLGRGLGVALGVEAVLAWDRTARSICRRCSRRRDRIRPK